MINELQSVKENCHGRFNERILYFKLAKKVEENNDIKFLIEGNVLTYFWPMFPFYTSLSGSIK